MNLPSQLLFKYTDTNTGGTVKKSTTEFTSSQNQSLSLAAINWRGGLEKRREKPHEKDLASIHTNKTLSPNKNVCHLHFCCSGSR